MSVVLAGDVGGTNCRLALCEWSGTSMMPAMTTLWSRTWRSRDHAGLEDVVRNALEKSPFMASAACIGVAGPVMDGVCHATNLPWTVDARSLARILGLAASRVALLNDVEAAARGLELLEGADLATLQAGTPAPDGARLLVSVGTGFGGALIEGGPADVSVLAAEPGHATFAPEDALEAELASFVAERQALNGGPRRASVESILSGPGLVLVHEFLARRARAGAGASDALPRDGAAVSLAAERGEPAAREALALFARVLGSALGNLALCPLPRGGVFLAGDHDPVVANDIRPFPLEDRRVLIGPPWQQGRAPVLASDRGRLRCRQDPAGRHPSRPPALMLIVDARRRAWPAQDA